MQPSKSILDRSFVYVPSTTTSVDQTWRRFGWRPLSEQRSSRDGSDVPSMQGSAASLAGQAAN